MTLRFALLLLLAPGPTAFAQPTQIEPTPTTAQPADPYWSPLRDDGWPLGQSLETLRGLRECNRGELVAKAGEPIPCRPAALVGPTHLALAFDWTTGVSLDDRTSGGAQAAGAELGYAVTRHLQLAGRYEVMGYGNTATMSTHVSQHVMGLAKWRLFTDEVDRDAWTLGVGGGWALRDAMLGGAAPLVRASIAREIGLYLDDANTLNAAVEVAYERALDERGAAAVLGSLRFGFELNVHEPKNLGTRDDDDGHDRHRTTFDLLVGPGLGLGMTLALRATPRISWLASASYVFGDTHWKQQSFDGASWALQTGPQVTLLTGFASPYVAVQGGAAWYSQPAGREQYWSATPELGLRLQNCGMKTEIGAWVRTDAANDFEALAGGVVLRGAFGGCGGGGNDHPQFATPYVPPPPPVVPQPQVEVAVPTVEIPSVMGGVDVNAGGQVAVEIKPIVVEVQLGASLLGGALSVRVDARLLPLAQLQGAGFVQIELTGQRSVLASYQAELGAVIGRNGARVDAWSVVSTSDTIVRAKITIWPPGSRPPR